MPSAHLFIPMPILFYLLSHYLHKLVYSLMFLILHRIDKLFHFQIVGSLVLEIICLKKFFEIFTNYFADCFSQDCRQERLVTCKISCRKISKLNFLYQKPSFFNLNFALHYLYP